MSLKAARSPPPSYRQSPSFLSLSAKEPNRSAGGGFPAGSRATPSKREGSAPLAISRFLMREGRSRPAAAAVGVLTYVSV